VYDPSALEAVVAAMATQPALVCLISHGSAPSYGPVPALAHIPERIRGDAESLYSAEGDENVSRHMNGSGGNHGGGDRPRPVRLWAYPADSPYFVIPSAGPKAYSPTDAAIAHSRSLTFLRRHLGGPHFDLEAIWEEHTYYEFVERSVAKTMGTMVVSAKYGVWRSIRCS
jgi:carboxymethylenebutenolidase